MKTHQIVGKYCKLHKKYRSTMNQKKKKCLGFQKLFILKTKIIQKSVTLSSCFLLFWFTKKMHRLYSIRLSL